MKWLWFWLAVPFLFSCTEKSEKARAPLPALTFDDAAIQRAATAALGEREGTILILNPHDGRLRTILNPRLAFQQAFPPGSTIKPFTALVAMRAGVATDDTRIACGRTFKREGYQVVCSHKRINNSLKLHHAIAYSCNYYFSTLAERMNAASFYATLDAFGFGARIGVNASETSGAIKHDDWHSSTAIGNDDNVLVTPAQLLLAFTALVNGGHLWQPRIAEEANFSAQEKRTLNLNPTQRGVLIEGMQGCVEYGSASEAGLQKLPYDVLGKTGTSGASNGFRTQGWFVSFLLNRKNAKTVAPEDLHLAALVFLKHASGADAAKVAADFYRQLIFGSPDPTTNHRPPTTDLKVHLVRENQTLDIDLESYVRGVLAAEASVETELEALKAQAVVSRTFAEKNRRRHQAEGYDFCSLTHCQRFVSQLAEHNKALVLRAAEETAGEVLQDERGQVADVYFHAACGGRTTNLEAVWGQPSPSYLRSVADDYCTTMTHKSWTQAIAMKDLLRALQTEERSHTGGQLAAIVITKRDVSGRAEFVTLEGARRRQLRGWDFALIVNRVLGWNTLKSARFDVQRAGSTFVFRGSGFGHGLGLCQEGAHVMARRGLRYQLIIEHYLPGAKFGKAGARLTKLGGEGQKQLTILDSSFSIPRQPKAVFLADRMKKEEWRVENAYSPTLPTRTMASEHFCLRYADKLAAQEVASLLPVLEAARADLQQRLQPATMPALTQVVLHSSTGDFVAATGQAAWAAAATRGKTMHLQPLAVLRKRGILTTTLRHELAHVALETLSRNRASRWLVEGLAIHFAGEARFYSQPTNRLAQEELEKRLAAPATAAEMQRLYALAYAEVRELVRTLGEAKVWRKAINL
ncbi:MAG: SpoIID/LytB domain-containing protein [Blastocatellia bacterium]